MALERSSHAALGFKYQKGVDSVKSTPFFMAAPLLGSGAQRLGRFLLAQLEHLVLAEG